MSVINLSEAQVKELLDWPMVCDAVEQAFRSVSEVRTRDDQPTSKQPARTFTPTEKGRIQNIQRLSIGSGSIHFLPRSAFVYAWIHWQLQAVNA